ncbi:MAG: serine/threonine-protein kinase [Polyangiaceae bacterium]
MRWRQALAETAPDPRATVTRDQMARLAVAAPIAAPTERAAFSPPSAADLPLVDLTLSVGATGTDLVVSSLLAEGGMGRVFLAAQRSLARDVAIKTVRDPFDQAQIEALLWEGAIAGHLDHPGVTPVHLLGVNRDGQPLLVMKRIVGTRWSDLLEGGGDVWARFPMLPRDRMRAHLDVLMEVARTVHFAHRRGVIHLDLKPDNVMIGELGEVYVVDWGVALPCPPEGRFAGFVGTPLFVAPEVVAGELVGPWTDVYMLGAILHLVLTGSPRHEGDGILEVLASAAASAPRTYSAEVPRELAELANRATRREPRERPADAMAVRAAIATHLEHTAALDLASEGDERLARARAARPVARREGNEVEGAAPKESERARELAAEARFAFRAALDRWPQCDEARTGLEHAILLGAELELDRENLPAALDLERELGAPPTSLVARREALARELDARAASKVELRRIREDADLSTGSAAQVRLLVVLMIVTVLGIAALSVVSTSGLVTHLTPLVPPLGGLVVFSIGVFWLRRAVLANAANRRLVVFFLATILFLGAHRTATLLFPLDTLAAEVRSELLLGAALSLGMATFLTRRLAPLPVCAFLAAGLVTATPAWANEIFNVAAMGMLLGLIVALRAERRASR